MVESGAGSSSAGTLAATLDPVDTLITLASTPPASDGHRLMWYKDVERAVAVERPDLDELVRRGRAYRCGRRSGSSSAAPVRSSGPTSRRMITALVPATLRAVDETTTLVPPVQLHDEPPSPDGHTVGEVLARATLLPIPDGASGCSGAVLAADPNESDSPDEKAATSRPSLVVSSMSVTGEPLTGAVVPDADDHGLAISLVSSAGENSCS